MKKLPKTETGFGIVANWVMPSAKIGGVLPLYLADDERQALSEAERNIRLEEFDTQNYLCEITIRPIREVSRVKVTKYE